MLGNFIRSSRMAAQTLMTRPLSTINSALNGPVASKNSAFPTSPAATQTFGIFPMRHLSTSPKVLKEDVTVTFHFSEKVTVTGREGDNLLDIIINNDVDIDGFGACEGTLACSTCHVIFSEEDFARLPDEATDEEMDMLDLAYGLEETSRLGCQVCMTKELSGITVKVPAGVNDQR